MSLIPFYNWDILALLLEKTKQGVKICLMKSKIGGPGLKLFTPNVSYMTSPVHRLA